MQCNILHEKEFLQKLKYSRCNITRIRSTLGSISPGSLSDPVFPISHGKAENRG